MLTTVLMMDLLRSIQNRYLGIYLFWDRESSVLDIIMVSVFVYMSMLTAFAALRPWPESGSC